MNPKKYFGFTVGLLMALSIACQLPFLASDVVSTEPTSTVTLLPADTATSTPQPPETPTTIPTVSPTVIPPTLGPATETPSATPTPLPTETLTATPTDTATATATATETPTVVPSPTPVPVVQVLWYADHETVDFSQWERKQGQAIFNNHTTPGSSDIQISNEIARSGNYALKLTLTEAVNGQVQGARIFRRWLDSDQGLELPEEAYYSAWYYFPQQYTPVAWWNIFQYKSKGEESLPMFSFNITNRENGDMYLYVWDKANGGVSHKQINDPVPIPIGQWVHIEAYVKKRFSPDGQLTVWQDGVKIIDATNIYTLRGENHRMHWSVNNYTDDIQPSNPVIYIDDAAISATRVGLNNVASP
ncbi:MAG: heparin lyase I family protein [Chloroflexota bacterium]